MEYHHMIFVDRVGRAAVRARWQGGESVRLNGPGILSIMIALRPEFIMRDLIRTVRASDQPFAELSDKRLSTLVSLVCTYVNAATNMPWRVETGNIGNNYFYKILQKTA